MENLGAIVDPEECVAALTAHDYQIDITHKEAK